MIESTERKKFLNTVVRNSVNDKFQGQWYPNFDLELENLPCRYTPNVSAKLKTVDPKMMSRKCQENFVSGPDPVFSSGIMSQSNMFAFNFVGKNTCQPKDHFDFQHQLSPSQQCIPELEDDDGYYSP